MRSPVDTPGASPPQFSELLEIPPTVRRLVLALALIAGVTAPALGASSAYADPSAAPLTDGVGIRLVDTPTATSNNPRSRVYIIDHLSSGESISRRIEVSNGTKAEAQVSVYSAAATLSNGSFVGGAGHASNELSRWTSTSPGTIILAAQQRAFVVVSIRVPPKTEPGERYGVVWAEVTSRPKSGGVTQVSRAGIRLYLSVGTGTAPKSDFQIVSMAAARDANNVALVTAMVGNTGQRALDLSGSLTLSDGPAGLGGGPFPVSLGTTLAIGETEPVVVKLDEKLPSGPWTATLTIKSGVTTRTAQAQLTFPTGPGQGPAVAARAPFALSGWMVGSAVALALIVLGMAGYFLRRRRRSNLLAK
jgi:hypothetical protein